MLTYEQLKCIKKAINILKQKNVQRDLDINVVKGLEDIIEGYKENE